MFEDNLLSLFKRCFKCGYKSAQVTSTTIGTYVKLKQRCCACLNVFVWDSQPFIQNQPACNILLSAAILFSGALPTMTLRVFQNMGCATIAERTFFRHQQHFLHHTVSAVWQKHQTMILDKLSLENKALVLGRADSPGHSAKFGSYTTMELEKELVIDVQLVQVNTQHISLL